ncbi:related to SFH5-phospholipid transporter [Fusarium fujikuroi IMI 58289]|uniref:Phosphatidylinositol transfer protein SFH5 n=1 Tax=Gibberella fujikuroi (strain CBS 195.34 / IMI 58289 / NRRL A-6831) TaxID=1279085 RepID=S0E4Y9_GIBF5|nr:related to SFH5-phospholipid transporter [Fusarium fujikuroi IMI 58289]CCT69745.1 related to SFH5-phospholipid transporter [Fusarium fujikuroi IMI 58289]SCN86652.1 related to SFH5-phospholipid transporter [Fusarium fujikuroi]SCO49982.1 related to SFH5-phospholipid transporter [Fusarium fujikuroi]
MATEQDKTVPAAVPAENPATPETPLSKLNARLEDIFTKTFHKEMWGVQLTNIDHVPTKVVLQKFLRANNDDPVAAEKQLTQALEWRKKMNPTALVTQTFDKSKFGDLGYVTVHKGENGNETIITWNIYGAVKDNKATFGNVEEFIKWRAAIMELSVQKLKLDQVTEPIPEGGEDPYQMIQVHDYLNVSFFRMDPAVKVASKETISVFSMAYPELLVHKYFVNVPAIMGWMFGAMKLFLAPATLRKFHPMTSGTSLATELKSIVSTLPKEYGGQGPSVKEGMSVSLTETGETKAEPSPTGVPEQTAAGDSTTAEKTAVAPESAPATDKPLAAEPVVAAAAPAPAPAHATEAVPAPIPAPVEAAKAETAEQAVEQAGEKPIEEALEKLSVDPAESEKRDSLATDAEKKEMAA